MFGNWRTEKHRAVRGNVFEKKSNDSCVSKNHGVRDLSCQPLLYTKKIILYIILYGVVYGMIFFYFAELTSVSMDGDVFSEKSYLLYGGPNEIVKAMSLSDHLYTTTAAATTTRRQCLDAAAESSGKTGPRVFA